MAYFALTTSFIVLWVFVNGFFADNFFFGFPAKALLLPSFWQKESFGRKKNRFSSFTG